MLKYIIFMAFFLPVAVFAQTLEVFVSILPQQFFVQRIGGDQVRVKVMVKPGQSPETFEPSPRLMAEYSAANIYFTIGMPFEQVWIKRLASLNTTISVVNTRPEAPFLLQQSQQQGQSSEAGLNYGSDHGSVPSSSTDKHQAEYNKWDPHTWLSPVLAIEQARVIAKELARLLPAKKSIFEHNFKQLEQQLKQLDQDIARRFENTDKHEFLTFHPAFSYFAARYHLTQRAIEINGKEPSAKQIARLINELSGKKVPDILIEKQFNTVIARTIARSLNAQLLIIDPLAYDYIKNMQDIAAKIRQSLF